MADTLLHLAPRGAAAVLPDVPGQAVSTPDEVRNALAQHGRAGAMWVASPESTVRLLSRLSGPPRGNHRLLLVGRAECEHWQWLQVLFRVVVAEGHGTKLLAPDDLADVLRADNRADLFVAGAIDPQAGIVVLFRGDLQPLVVPLSWFKPTGEGTTPDPTDFEVIDGGTAIRMGDYEASARSILYDLDPVFRRRAKKLLVERDDSFGGALRRLRLLRGLPRSAFEPEVTEKEVARIELGHVKKPRTSTVKALAAKLQVEPDELASY